MVEERAVVPDVVDQRVGQRVHAVDQARRDAAISPTRPSRGFVGLHAAMKTMLSGRRRPSIERETISR